MSVRLVKVTTLTGTREGDTRDENTAEVMKEEGEAKHNRPCNDLDDVLEVVGSHGKYQKTFLYAILSPLTVMEPLLRLNLLFMLYEPDHWCSVPGREEAGVDLATWKNLTIPREADGTLSKCRMYGVNRSVVTACSSGWDYDKTDYDHTIPSDFDWVCERGEWATWVLTASAVGNAVGTVALGQAADKIGRKPVFVMTLLLTVFGRIGSLYVADNFLMFVALTFVAGLGFPMIYIVPAMIGVEFSSKEFRSWIYSWTWVTPVIGLVLLPWIAYFTRHWYTIGLITSIPCCLAFVAVLWVPESPRWLLSQGKISKAAEVTKGIAKRNGAEGKLSDKQLESMLEKIAIKQEGQGGGGGGGDQRGASSGSVLTLFSRRTLAKHTILVTTCWTMNVVIYNAITLSASSLSGNQFLNFFILAVIEGFAGPGGNVLIDKVGRRWTQVLFFLVCLASSGMASVAAGYKVDGNGTWMIVSLIAAAVARFATTLTFLVVYLQATEIFPTPLRSTGIGVASTSASVAGIFTPYIVYTRKFHAAVPWFIIVLLSVVGTLSSAYLPETLNQRLPETLDDAAVFGKGNKFWSLRPPKKEEDEAQPQLHETGIK